MKDFEKIDRLLEQALSPTVQPDNELNKAVIKQIKESNVMKRVNHRAAMPVLAAILILMASVTALAAWNLLSPKQVAESVGDKNLAAAFEDENAIEINESVVSDGYSITLLGVVSGENLSAFKDSSESINADRTYAVVSIGKEDGSPMPSTQDEDYDKVPFFISPLVKGQKPWLLNIASMNGAYSSIVKDGIMYRLIECDGVGIFADRGLYLCVSSSNFYDTKAYDFNEQTGEITPKKDYEGVNILFNLPLDVTKANPEEAERYLKDLFKEDEPETAEDTNELNLDELMANAELIKGSEKVLTVDENGMVNYEFDNGKVSVAAGELFKEDQNGLSDFFSVSEADSTKLIVRFSRDEKGVITGMTYRVK